MEELRLKTGDKIDLHLGRGPYYRTKIDEIEPDGSMLVMLPAIRGIPIVLRTGQEIYIYFYRETGRYMQEVRVTGLYNDGELRMVQLKPLTEPVKQQRRESYRVPVMLRAVLRPYDMGPFPKHMTPQERAELDDVLSVNISATGISLRTENALLPGQRIFLRVYLAWPEPDSEPLEVLSEVRQAVRIESKENIYQVGITFIGLSLEQSMHLSRFVLTEDRRQNQKKKLMQDS